MPVIPLYKIKRYTGRVIALLLGLCVSCIAVYKVLYVPLTFDEETTSVFYPNFRVWEIMMFPDNWPSNHILHTLLVKLSENIFGVELWSVRLPSLLSLGLMFWFLWLIAKRYFNSSPFLFCLPFFVLLCNPFLLDFFGLARGYALSNTLMVGSVYATLVFAGTRKLLWYFMAIVLAMLAAYANFSLLIYWVTVHIVLGSIQLFYTITEKQGYKRISLQFLTTAMIATAFLALCYVPLYKMQSTNQFIYWSKESFYYDTVVDQVRTMRYGVIYNDIPNWVIAHWVLYILYAIAGYVAIRIIRKKNAAILSNPLTVSLTVLAVFWGVNMAQTMLLGTPYLTTRTALCYFVLYALVFAFFINDISNQLRLLRYTLAPFVIIFCAVHLGKAVSFDRVLEWWFDANTYNVQNYLKDYRDKHPELRAVELNTTWLFSPSFSFYDVTGKTPWIKLTPYHQQVDTTSNTLFYYATPEEAEQLKPYYNPIINYGNTNSVLMQRK